MPEIAIYFGVIVMATFVAYFMLRRRDGQRVLQGVSFRSLLYKLARFWRFLWSGD